MSAALIVIDPASSVAAAARLMREEGLSWLPVLTEGRLVGVLGRSDLLAVLLRPDAAMRAEVVEGVLVGRLMIDPSRVAVDVANGVVTLAGQLETGADAEVAVVLTRRVEGVEDVVDRLTWQAPERPENVPVRALF